MNKNKNFRELLIEIREKNKLSQQELADFLGVSRQTIARWEAGKNHPSTNQIYKLCQAFGLDAAALLSASHGENGLEEGETEEENADSEAKQDDAERRTKHNRIGAIVAIGIFLFLAVTGLVVTVLYAIKDAQYDSTSTALIISLPRNTPMIVLSVILFLLILILIYILIVLLRGKRQ